MLVSAINNNSQPTSFKAKFLDTPAIRKVAQWAIDNNKYEEINAARKQIDYSAVKVRIHLNLATDIEGYPIAIFKRYFPRLNKEQDIMYEHDFIVSKPIIYEGKDKSISPEEFGFKKIVQMGCYVTRNKMFKDIVVSPPKHTDL